MHPHDIAHHAGLRKRLCFVVESGTDVRMVEGLAQRSDLTLLARRIVGGREISHASSVAVPTIVGPSSRARFAWAVLRHLLSRQQIFDVVLVQGYALAALSANLAMRLRGTPTAMLVCSPTEGYYLCRAECNAPGKRFRKTELLGLRVLARLNAYLGIRYVALSSHLRDVIRGHRAGGSVAVVPVYGVDLERFRPTSTSKEAIRRDLGIPVTGPIIFFSSRISPEKDAETFLSAIALLARQGRDLWVLNLSGGHEEFLAAARSAGVAERIVAGDAVHPLRELPSYYQASDLCVQASREEGLGFSPLEALACEVPVVATAVGGLRETIVDGVTGWTYPRGDAKGLASRISEALSDPQEGLRRARNGRKMVEERFDSRLAFDQLDAIINDLSRPSVRREDRE